MLTVVQQIFNMLQVLILSSITDQIKDMTSEGTR